MKHSKSKLTIEVPLFIFLSTFLYAEAIGKRNVLLSLLKLLINSLEVKDKIVFIVNNKAVKEMIERAQTKEKKENC